jgi:hypothetical protein
MGIKPISSSSLALASDYAPVRVVVTALNFSENILVFNLLSLRFRAETGGAEVGQTPGYKALTVLILPQRNGSAAVNEQGDLT